jgi:acetylornithine deacetylase/succinyl-diaminopimelate desuccinylase-like protein
LIQQGHVGDAVICCEGNPGQLPVVGKGMSIFEVAVHRTGDTIHEMVATEDVPHPIIVGHQLVRAMLDKNAEFAQTTLPLDLGSETYFVGIFQAGDFYNRVPTECRIVGTRRYAPERTFAEVEAELGSMAAHIAAETGAQIDVEIRKQRDGFQIDPDVPISVAIRDAYASIHGGPIPLVGMKFVADGSGFMQEAGVPALQYGPGLARAHADVEWVALDDIVDTAKVFLLAALNYLGVIA